MKTIQLTSYEEKRLLEMLHKALAYDDEHYPDRVAKVDQKFIDNIKNQLDGQKV